MFQKSFLINEKFFKFFGGYISAKKEIEKKRKITKVAPGVTIIANTSTLGSVKSKAVAPKSSTPPSISRITFRFVQLPSSQLPQMTFEQKKRREKRPKSRTSDFKSLVVFLVFVVLLDFIPFKLVKINFVSFLKWIWGFFSTIYWCSLFKLKANFVWNPIEFKKQKWKSKLWLTDFWGHHNLSKFNVQLSNILFAEISSYFLFFYWNHSSFESDHQTPNFQFIDSFKNCGNFLVILSVILFSFSLHKIFIKFQVFSINFLLSNSSPPFSIRSQSINLHNERRKWKFASFWRTLFVVPHLGCLFRICFGVEVFIQNWNKFLDSTTKLISSG